jgi:hypothetical protein
MALIIDPDLLADSAADDGSTEVYINTATKTIKLVATGDLSTDGVTLKCLYSFLKEEWKNDPNTKNLAAFQFPMVPITDEEFEFVGGWDFFNDTARYLVRTGGWTVKNTSNATTQIWAGIIGLGSVESNDQPYFWQGGANPATNFQLQGQINQAIQILKDDDGDGNTSEGADFDRRTSLTLFVREQGQTFAQATLADIGVSSMKGQVYRFPLTTGSDLKIVVADTGIKASGTGYPADVAPYSGMTITYYATPQAKALQGGSYNFGVVVNANGQTLQKAYEFLQYALRQNADIDSDASTVTGRIAAPLARFVGDTLYTLISDNAQGGGTGVFIENFASADLNSVFFTDNTGAERQYAYTANLTINFNDNLVSDGQAKYWVYFSTLPGAGNDWGESGAVLVDDGSAADMTGSIVGSSVTKTFDYDGNSQGGRTPATDAGITVVAIGQATGQYVRATGTIQRSKSNAVSLVAPLERNFSNP